MPRKSVRDLAGAAVLITGAGAGVGAATACQLANRGARVAVVDLDPAAAEQVAGELPSAIAIAANVSEPAQMQDAFARTLDEFGRLDIVIANAGVVHRSATFRALDPDELQRVLDVDVTGVLNTVKPAIEPLIATKGRAVLVSSVGAFMPAPGGVIYSAAKAAVEMLGRGLRLELAPFGVGVTVTYFGPVQTALVERTLETPEGKVMEDLVPRPLRKRISAEQAAAGVVRAIELNQPRLIIPARWRVLDLARVFAPVIEDRMIHDPKINHVVRHLDAARRKTPNP